MGTTAENKVELANINGLKEENHNRGDDQLGECEKKVEYDICEDTKKNQIRFSVMSPVLIEANQCQTRLVRLSKKHTRYFGS